MAFSFNSLAFTYNFGIAIPKSEIEESGLSDFHFAKHEFKTICQKVSHYVKSSFAPSAIFVSCYLNENCFNIIKYPLDNDYIAYFINGLTVSIVSGFYSQNIYIRNQFIIYDFIESIYGAQEKDKIKSYYIGHIPDEKNEKTIKRFISCCDVNREEKEQEINKKIPIRRYYDATEIKIYEKVINDINSGIKPVYDFEKYIEIEN